MSDLARLKPDLLWITLSGSPTSAINNRERRRAWNLAQIMIEAMKVSCAVILEGSAKNSMWETSGLMRLESMSDLHVQAMR
eukprot:1748862-Pyramimonas_sp.AAC.1